MSKESVICDGRLRMSNSRRSVSMICLEFHRSFLISSLRYFPPKICNSHGRRSDVYCHVYCEREHSRLSFTRESASKVVSFYAVVADYFSSVALRFYSRFPRAMRLGCPSCVLVVLLMSDPALVRPLGSSPH